MQTFTLSRKEMELLKENTKFHCVMPRTPYWAQVLTQFDERILDLHTREEPINISHIKEKFVLDCVSYGKDGLKCQHQRAYLVQLGLEKTTMRDYPESLQFYIDLAAVKE